MRAKRGYLDNLINLYLYATSYPWGLLSVPRMHLLNTLLHHSEYPMVHRRRYNKGVESRL